MRLMSRKAETAPGKSFMWDWTTVRVFFFFLVGDTARPSGIERAQPQNTSQQPSKTKLSSILQISVDASVPRKPSWASCAELHKKGKVEFIWSAHPVGNSGGGKKRRRYQCRVCWLRRGSLFSNPVATEAETDKYFLLYEAEAINDVQHFWEPYQREPRWDVQIQLLEMLEKKITDASRSRFGEQYQAKYLLKAQGREVVMDEKLAYLTVHSMGGYEQGGHWNYVPASLEGKLAEEQEWPQTRQYSWERYNQWREIMKDREAGQLEWDGTDDAYPLPGRRISTRRRLPGRDGPYGHLSNSEGTARPPTHCQPSDRGRFTGFGMHGHINDSRTHVSAPYDYFCPHEHHGPSHRGDYPQFTNDRSPIRANKRQKGDGQYKVSPNDRKGDSQRMTKSDDSASGERSKSAHATKSRSARAII
ncbi:hypothetical protein MPH_02563 [Macrophomina phaseolina MS6]|uniref:Uncharacterized protein n=1 Tax=Macrophomina phaseolina (strain MS6) TaxID=1126212 RepID=K2RZF5_MACPH|nr:hypothetical protein MPH_02563 [Macrophomina phaseolina MS6]